MRVVCAPGVPVSPRDVQQSRLFDYWFRRLHGHDHGMRVGTVTVHAAFVWSGRIAMLQLGARHGRFEEAVFLRGPTVDMLTVVTDGKTRHMVHVEQPRVAVGQIVLANPAGMVDADELPAVAALREAGEEVGAHIRWGRAISMHPTVLGTEDALLVSPGGTDEEVTFFVVEGRLSTSELRKLSKRIGGLASEGERLKIYLTPFDSFRAIAMIRHLVSVSPGLADQKAVTSLLLYEQFLRLQPRR